MTDIERWENPQQREIIQDVIQERISHAFKEDIVEQKRLLGFLLWCVEGAPWDNYTKNAVASAVRAKVFFENVPHFV